MSQLVVPFTLATAFSSDPSGGNPAATIFVDEEDVSSERLMRAAMNFNQPMMSVVSHRGPSDDSSQDSRVARFNIRWFTSNKYESPLCGHGALAAAKTIFNKSPPIVSKEVEVIEFSTFAGTIFRAVQLDGGWIQITLPATNVQEVSPVEHKKLAQILNNAFGKEVHINGIAKADGSVPGFESYIMFELDKDENLAECKVNPDALNESGYVIHAVTQESKNLTGDELYLSRMFCPRSVLISGEDHVCGSANSLVGPYWSNRKNIRDGQPMKGTQVSQRGGHLKVVWQAEKCVIQLSGEAVVFAEGKVIL